MEIFTFTPGGIETIDAFNMRLAKFASEQNVVGVKSSTIGGTLVLSLALDQDLPPAPVLLRPFVGVVGNAGLEALETALTAVLDAMKAQDKPEDDITSVPVECVCLDAPHAPTSQQGYAIFLISVGELEFENG